MAALKIRFVLYDSINRRRVSTIDIQHIHLDFFSNSLEVTTTLELVLGAIFNIQMYCCRRTHLREIAESTDMFNSINTKSMMQTALANTNY